MRLSCFFSGLNNELHIATKAILESVEDDVHILLVIFLLLSPTDQLPLPGGRSKDGDDDYTGRFAR